MTKATTQKMKKLTMIPPRHDANIAGVDDELYEDNQIEEANADENQYQIKAANNANADEAANYNKEDNVDEEIDPTDYVQDNDNKEEADLADKTEVVNENDNQPIEPNDNPLAVEMGTRYGPRSSKHSLLPRRPCDYSHLHTILEGTVMTQHSIKKVLKSSMKVVQQPCSRN